MRKLILTLLLLASPAFGGWSACYKLQINGSGLTNFPIILSSANNSQVAAILPYFATVGTGSGLVTSASGYDIIVSTDSACNVANKVPFERILWNSSATAVEFAFKGTTNGTYYLGIGNSAIVTDQSSAAGTWASPFKCVYHTAASSPGGSTLASPSVDSAGGCGNATLNGTPTATASPVGSAASFNGSTQSLSFTGWTAAPPFTYVVWIKPTNFTGYRSFIGGAGQSFGMRTEQTSAKIFATRTSCCDLPVTTNAVSAGAWTQVVFTVDASGNYNYYLNSTGNGSGTNLAWTAFGSNTNTIGVGENLGEFFNGAVAESYLIGAVESSTWVSELYNSQKASSTFVTVTATVSGPPNSQSIWF